MNRSFLLVELNGLEPSTSCAMPTS